MFYISLVASYFTCLNVVLLIQRISLIVADAITLVATAYYTYGTVKASRKAGIAASLSTMLLREGRIVQYDILFLDIYKCYRRSLLRVRIRLISSIIHLRSLEA